MAPASFGRFIRTHFAIGAAIAALALYQTQVQTEALLKIRTRYKWVLFMMLLALQVAVGTYVALRPDASRRWWSWLEALPIRTIAARLAGVVLLLLPVPLFIHARGDFFGQGMEAFFRLLWLVWWLVLVQTLGMRLLLGLEWHIALATTLLLDGMSAQLVTLSSAVSDYPFSMGWSEASRYYYGSLVFASNVYGEALPLSVMHGTRYLLQSVPFMFGTSALWLARLWQVLLWVGLTFWSSWALARRLRLPDPSLWFLSIGWLFLYYFQGAVYYHLQVPVIMVLMGFAFGRPWRTLLAVVGASIWAGMSRVNWFPVPAMIAISLYVIETEMDPKAGVWQYIRMPLYWGVAGMAGAIAGQAFYIWISGNTNLGAFASSFTSDLLWYRWWPSATNSIGIIPGVLIITAPVAALIAWKFSRLTRRSQTIRFAALGAMLLILLAGGLIVSTKIGGGGDLHNMDAYMVLLAIFGAYAAWGEFQTPGRRSRTWAAVPGALLVLLVLIPTAFALLRLGSPFRYDRPLAFSDLAQLREEVAARSTEGEVLFMYERHLVTFGLAPGVRLVPEYEVVTLMEMAISGNGTYLQRYYDDLAAHRFSAIVAHPQNLGVETGDFIEENDAWNRYIGQPLLCQYKPALTLDYSNVQVLVPRERPCTEYPPQIGGE